MLVTLLVWAWSRGMRSSRQIERACSEVVSYRVICAGDAPDHVTISRFRKDNHTACQALFTQVLILAARLGLGRLETIALDGVKIASNASKDANRTEDGLRRAAEAEAARIAAAAVAAHAAGDDAEDDLYGEDDPGRCRRSWPIPAPARHGSPRRWRSSTRRQAERCAPPTLSCNRSRDGRAHRQPSRIDARRRRTAERDGKAQDYLARLDAGETVMGRVPVGAEVAAAERRLAEAVAAQHTRAVPGAHRGRRRGAARTEAGRRAPPGAPRRPELDTALRKQGERTAAAGQRRRNITDPDSRLQPLRGGGWVQGYNCQAFTSEDGLILATGVGTGPADYDYFPEMVDKAGAAAQLIDPPPRQPTRRPGSRADRGDALRRRLLLPREPHRAGPGPVDRHRQVP